MSGVRIETVGALLLVLICSSGCTSLLERRNAALDEIREDELEIARLRHAIHENRMEANLLQMELAAACEEGTTPCFDWYDLEQCNCDCHSEVGTTEYVQCMAVCYLGYDSVDALRDLLDAWHDPDRMSRRAKKKQERALLTKEEQKLPEAARRKLLQKRAKKEVLDVAKKKLTRKGFRAARLSGGIYGLFVVGVLEGFELFQCDLECKKHR